MDLGYTHKTGRLIKVTFSIKPGKIGQDLVKALRPINLVSFILKLLEVIVSPIRKRSVADRSLDLDEFV